MIRPFNHRARPNPAAARAVEAARAQLADDVNAAIARRRAVAFAAVLESANRAGVGVLEWTEGDGYSVEVCRGLPAGVVYTFPTEAAAAEFRRASKGSIV
jgi:hypothetical protein